MVLLTLGFENNQTLTNMPSIDKCIGTGLLVLTAREHENGLSFLGPVVLEVVDFL